MNSLLKRFSLCPLSGTPSSIKKEIREIKDSSVTQKEFNKELRISGLEAEKRMIQATDRKLLDVRRQTEIEEKIKKLRTK